MVIPNRAIMPRGPHVPVQPPRTFERLVMVVGPAIREDDVHPFAAFSRFGCLRLPLSIDHREQEIVRGIA